MENSSGKYLHIVAFDVPFPANYGGVIDIFHKIRWLHQKGVHITLHCFEYGRGIQEELRQYCSQVYYYPRRTGIGANLSVRPYVVASRKHPDLLSNLVNDNHPILFEGLHTCSLINHPRLRNRLKIYRESNIEHHYYIHLAKAEKNLAKKFFFLTEALKLRLFQKKLQHADLILTVSQEDNRYLATHFPLKRVIYIPSFHANDTVSSAHGEGNYMLYHGKLSVSENYRAAQFLLTKVMKESDFPLVIAGMDPPKKLINLVKKHRNAKLIANPSQEEMDKLIAGAQVNLMFTFQATGLKLKLLNTLFNGRHCVANSKMLSGTHLEPACYVANSVKEIKTQAERLMKQPFAASDLQKRITLLAPFNNNQNIEKLILLIFDSKQNCNGDIKEQDFK